MNWVANMHAIPYYVYELYCYALANLRSIDEFFRSVVLGLFHNM